MLPWSWGAHPERGGLTHGRGGPFPTPGEVGFKASASLCGARGGWSRAAAGVLLSMWGCSIPKRGCPPPGGAGEGLGVLGGGVNQAPLQEMACGPAVGGSGWARAKGLARADSTLWRGEEEQGGSEDPQDVLDPTPPSQTPLAAPWNRTWIQGCSVGWGP